MKIGLIDADLSDSGTNFPNLALMKLSNYHQQQGNETKLITYNDIPSYDKVFVAKVFSSTNIPVNLNFYPNIEIGGTGFDYDKQSFLADKIEHTKPDYNLYPDDLGRYYSNHSIGFTTRFCFRQCPYCVNRNKKKAIRWAELSEFDDDNNDRITLLDDNLLAHKNRIDILRELQSTDKPFEFKQGLDFRLVNDEIINILENSKYAGDYIFAFDNIKDKQEIIRGLETWKKHNNKRLKFYVLTAYDRQNNYDKEFWKQDIIDTFERIKILMSYKALPYVMRYEKYENSPYRGMYINLAGWSNQPHLFKKMSFREYSKKKGGLLTNGDKGSAWRYMKEFEKKHPEIAKEYFDMKWE